MTLRVCLGPLEIAGIAANLVVGLRAHGVAAQAVLHTPHRFGYASADLQPSHWLPRAWRALGRRRRELPASRWLAKATVVLAHRALGWAVLAWALPRFDAFVFLYGETFTNTLTELRLLRAWHRRTVMIFVGSDARPPAIDGARFPSDQPVAADVLVRATAVQCRRVQALEAAVDVCINAPATAQFHRRPVVDWFAFGLPRRIDDREPVTRAPGAPLRIVHSPSHPAAKGTARIEAAVARLREPVEWVRLEGLSNDAVLDEIARCDLAIDQLWSDTPMAGFAAEAAALGKPVLVGGYFAAEAGPAMAGRAMPPTRFVTPEHFDAALGQLVGDAALRASLGARGREFVRAHWSAEAVAGRLLRVLRNDIPADWWLDPQRVASVHGCGLPADVAAQRVRALIQQGGVAALGVADKPALQAAFVALAGHPGPAQEATA